MYVIQTQFAKNSIKTTYKQTKGNNMLKLVPFLLLLTTLNAYSMCSKEAADYAVYNQAEIWEVEEKTVLSEVVENEFDETYGVGYYDVYLTDGDKEITVSVDMRAYTNEDDSTITCEVVGVFSDEG
jgi:hypothetical protein